MSLLHTAASATVSPEQQPALLPALYTGTLQFRTAQLPHLVWLSCVSGWPMVWEAQQGSTLSPTAAPELKMACPATSPATMQRNSSTE